MDFFEEVYRLTRQIPKGKVSTYGAIAKALGDMKAARAVGLALNLNPDPEFTPCYRVVMSDGTIGGFGLGVKNKIERLKRDGIEVRDSRVVGFEKHFFDDFETSYPLRELRREQLKLREKVVIRDDFDSIESIAGFDVAYRKKENKLVACASYAIVDYQTKEVVDRRWIYGNVKIPYIPTYLAFTEYPFIKKLWDEMMEKPSVLMFDGNGILHPFRIGLASYAGVLLDAPSVGVAKSHLYGVSGEKREDGFYMEDEKGKRIGYALIKSKTVKKPIYVSAGHRVSLETAVKIVKHLSVYRIPEPIRQAHMLAKVKIREI